MPVWSLRPRRSRARLHSLNSQLELDSEKRPSQENIREPATRGAAPEKKYKAREQNDIEGANYQKGKR